MVDLALTDQFGLRENPFELVEELRVEVVGLGKHYIRCAALRQASGDSLGC